MSQLNQTPAGRTWLVLIHHLPPKPDYLRVKVRRRLERIGALAIKNSVYVLPDGDETREDFQWLAVEIQRDGGDVLVCRSELIAGISDDEVIERFNAERDEVYHSIRESVAADVRASRLQSDKSGNEWRDIVQKSYARHQRRFDDTARLDFFGAKGRSSAEEEIRQFHDLLQRGSQHRPDDARAEPEIAQQRGGREAIARGSTWVTRTGIFVDRIASAWLIRKFIDPEARFKFVGVARYTRASGELRFDMMPAEYTHDGDKCTFEVLLERFKLDDTGLVAISEIVHDIDLKDDKFARIEAAGVAAVLTGIANTVADDEGRLAAAFPLLDALYDGFRKT